MVIPITPTPITGFPVGYINVPNITPFTYKDGLTYLSILEDLRRYIRDIVVPHSDASFKSLTEAVEQEITELVNAVNESLASQAEGVNNALTEQTEDVAQRISVLTNSVNDKISNVTTALEQQSAEVSAELAEQNALVVSRLAENIENVNAAIATIIDNTIEVSDPVITGVLRDNTSTGRRAVAEIASENAGTFGFASLGDSITAAGQNDPAEGRVISYASLISEYAGMKGFNPSVPGERQGDIATRYGVGIVFTVPGNAIPGNPNRFVVNLVSPDVSNFIGKINDGEQSHFIGTYEGVPVDVLYDKTNWTMGRLDGSSVAKPVKSSGGVFRTNSSRGVQNAILISFGGRNGSTPSLVSQTREMLKRMPEPRRALLVPPLYRTPGTGNPDQLAALVNEFTGVKFFDIRSYLAVRGMDDEGVPKTAQDQADINNNIVPASLFLDGIHPTAAGHRAIARRLLEELISLGWVSAASAYIPPRVVPLGPTVLNVARGGGATIASSTAMRTAQRFELLLHVNPEDDTMFSEPIARRHAIVDGSNVFSWAFQTLANGVLRGQTWPDENNWIGYDSAVPTWPAGWFTLRIVVDTTVRSASYYIGPDTSDFDSITNWAQIGTTITGAPSSLANKDVPLQLQLPGLWKRFVMKSGSTVLVDQRFTEPAASYPGWTFANAAVVPA